jgi:uncharacterized membrane protein (TIGR02234 family)
MTARRELLTAALLCLVGAGLALFASGQSWATAHAVDSVLTRKSVTGGELTGAATALGWAGLAGLLALFAVGGRVRAGLGVLLALFGVGLVYVSATSTGHEHVLSVAADKSQSIQMAGLVAIDTTAWPIVSVIGGVLLAAGGLLVAIRGARWPGMSSRYERSATKKQVEPDDAVGMWKALDRGEDPTGRE